MEQLTGVYVNGEWIDGPETLTVTDLSENDTFAEVASADESLAQDAVSSADNTSEELRNTTLVERAGWLESIAEEIRELDTIIAETIAKEAGKPISSARGEVESAAERFDRAAEEVRAITGEYREGSTSGHEGWEAIVKKEPIGPTLVIGPYNYPIATVSLQVAPALGAGNPVVLKPSSYTPATAIWLAEAIDNVEEIPDGAFNLVCGESREIGDPLAEDDRFDLIAMVGSSGAGEHVADESGMTRLHMELGGNAPALVFPDADTETAASNCVSGSVKYAGQRCSAVSRILAHEDTYDELVAEMESQMEEITLGDPMDEETTVGPAISESHASYIMALIDDAVEKGANILVGGDREGYWVEPTLLVDVPKDARILYEEQFGPVAAVAELENEDEMLEVADFGDLALDASVFTSDYNRALSVSDQLDVGAVRINGAPSHGLGDIPFGGNNRSGIGRQGLYTTIEDMMTTKSIIL